MRLLGVRVALRSRRAGVRRFTGVVLGADKGVTGYLKGGLHVVTGVLGVDCDVSLGLGVGETVGVKVKAGARRRVGGVVFGVAEGDGWRGAGILLGVFSGDFAGVFPRIPAGGFAGTFAGVFVGVFVGILPGVLGRVFAGVPSGVPRVISAGIFAGTFVGLFPGILAGTLVGVFPRVFVGIFPGMSVAVFADAFASIFPGIFSSALTPTFTPSALSGLPVSARLRSSSCHLASRSAISSALANCCSYGRGSVDGSYGSLVKGTRALRSGVLRGVL